MKTRLLSLILISASMAVLVYGKLFEFAGNFSPTLVLGFMLISAYCLGYLLEGFGLPRITGYIFAGLFMGPYFLKFYSHEAVLDLGFLNSLALAFIAFCAGGELKLANLKKKLKSLIFLIVGVTVSVFLGVSMIVYLISGFVPYLQSFDYKYRLAISAIIGIIAVARSPSSTIAIISESKAKGEYTNTVLSVTIATDVVIIMLFAIIISFCELLTKSGTPMSIHFIGFLLLEIVIAFVLGFILGKVMIFLIEKVRVEFPVVITALGFLVIKFSHLASHYLSSSHEINLNLEPLLICMAAGFTVQNFSKHGDIFLHRMDNVSVPVYVAFFAITGASINVDLLKQGWLFGLVIVITRIIMIFLGSYFSGRLSGDDPKIYRNTWLGFITQAGVSLGLLAEVARRFPEIGPLIQTILIAAITLNQIIGPVGFKYALFKVGEAQKHNEGAAT